MPKKNPVHPKGSNIMAGEPKSRLTALGALAIIFLGVLIYSNILHAPFVFDDYISVVDNDAVKSIEKSLLDISNNRYLTMLSFAFNYAAFGLKPFTYHFINNIIHVINALLVYYFVILTFRTPYFNYQPSSGSPSQIDLAGRPIHPFSSASGGQAHSPLFIAFFSAFIFISHPIQTQAVTYIAQRATSMAAMFYLLSLVMYIKWRLSAEQQSNRAAEQQSRSKTTTALLLYCASLISVILAMKTKEIAFTLPFVITLYEFSFFNKSPNTERRTTNLRRFLYLLPILLTLLIIPLSMIDIKKPVETFAVSIDVQSRETENISRADYLLTQVRVIVTYLRLLILPINQNLDYRYPIYNSFFDLEVFLSFLFLLTIMGTAVYLMQKSYIKINPFSPFLSKRGQREFGTDSLIHRFTSLRLIAFGIFWFFITLSVESSIIPIRDVIVEHRLYIPSIGFFIVFVALMDYILSSMRLKVAMIIVILGLLSISAYSRNTIWKDSQKLWEDVIAKAPNNVRAYTELGAIFRDEGQYIEAMNQFEKALKINKHYALTYYNIGYVHYKSGSYKNALMYFRKTMEFKLPALLRMETFNSMGMTYSEMGNDIDAVNAFKEAIKALPTSIIPYNNLGRQYIKMGNFDLAIEILKRGLEIREEPHLRSNLSVAYATKKQRDINTEQIKK